jgi:hypothetical protein
VKIKNSTPEKSSIAATFEDLPPDDFDNVSKFLKEKKSKNFNELKALYDEISRENLNTNTIDEQTELCKQTNATKENEDERDIDSLMINDRTSKESISVHNEKNKEIDSVDNNNDNEKFDRKNPKYLRLKVIKMKGDNNDEYKFVDFNNRLVTFCGKCQNCRREKDCEKCKHCR